MGALLVMILHFDPRENHPQDSIFHLGIHAGDLTAVTAQTGGSRVLTHALLLVAVVESHRREKHHLLPNGVDSVVDSVVWNTGQVDAYVKLVVVENLDLDETLGTSFLELVVGRVKTLWKTRKKNVSERADRTEEEKQ